MSELVDDGYRITDEVAFHGVQSFEVVPGDGAIFEFRVREAATTHSWIMRLRAPTREQSGFSARLPDAPENSMTEQETVRSFLERDHERLEQLLARAGRDLANIDEEAFGEFRRGLLRHIGMEEKILLPAIQRLRGGEPLPIAASLRLGHGAIAALLVPTPRGAVLRALTAVLAIHNQVEDGPDGVYAPRCS